MNKRNLVNVLWWKAATFALHGWKYLMAVLLFACPVNDACIDGIDGKAG